MKEYNSTIADFQTKLDALDWGIRQLQSEREITMSQMILIFRMWSAVDKKGGRLTDRQLRAVARQYRRDRQMFE